MEQTAKIQSFQDLRKPLKRTKWTQSDDDELKQHYALKRDDVRIGELMGRTKSAITGRRNTLGLVAHHKSRITKIDIRKPAPPPRKTAV